MPENSPSPDSGQPPALPVAGATSPSPSASPPAPPAPSESAPLAAPLPAPVAAPLPAPLSAPLSAPPAPSQPLAASPSPWQFIDALLRRPVVLQEYATRGGRELFRLTASLLVTTILSLALFGLLIGSFSGHEQLWAAPVKVVIVGLGSGLLCLPSLYIFAALAGRELDLRGASGCMLAILARAALLLLGFAPLAWLFATSTSSLLFYGTIIIVLSIISTFVGLGFLTNSRARATDSATRGTSGYLVIWSAVFLLVVLQMPTSLRPIIGRADTFLPTEKRSFVGHWFRQLDGPVQEPRRVPPARSDLPARSSAPTAEAVSPPNPQQPSSATPSSPRRSTPESSPGSPNSPAAGRNPA